MSSIALDVGTSTIKAVYFDEDNCIIKSASRPTPVVRPRKNYAEYDPEQIWQLIKEVLLDLSADKIEFITVTGQSDGCWAVDKNGRALRNAIIWNDGRAQEILIDWESRGVVERAFRINGATLFPGAQATLLKWIELNEPEVFNNLGYVMFCKDYVAARLTGEIFGERSDASVPWLDIATKEYSQKLFDLYDMPWAGNYLPPLRPEKPGPVGHLLSEPAAELGLQPGTPVMSALFDCPSMALGAGVTKPGQALVILGTTLVIQMVTDKVDNSGTAGGMTLTTGMPNTWLRLFGTMSCTDSLNWMTKLIGLDSVEKLFELAECSPLGSNGIRILPYFSPAGERAPFLEPAAMGTIYGLTLDHGKQDLARALIEALTFSLVHCIESLTSKPHELTLSGGGSRSEFWAQLIADATGIETIRLDQDELGVYGANIWGRLGTGDLSLAAGTAENIIRYHPNSSRTDDYQALYEDFTTLRENALLAWMRLFEKRDR